MRAIGMLFMLIGVAGLIVGIGTGYATYSSVIDLYNNIEEGRQIITGKIDDVQEMFDDVDVVYERVDKTVTDYEQGRLDSLDEERIKDLTRDIRTLAGKSMDLKTEIEGEIDRLEEIESSVSEKYTATITVALVSLVCLIASGWLFGFGALIRCIGRR